MRAIVIRQADAQRRDAEPREQLRQTDVAARIRVPLRQHDDGAARRRSTSGSRREEARVHEIVLRVRRVERAGKRQRAGFAARRGGRVRGTEDVVGRRRRCEERVRVLHHRSRPTTRSDLDGCGVRADGRSAASSRGPIRTGLTTRSVAADVGEPLFPAMKETLRSCVFVERALRSPRATRSRSPASGPIARRSAGRRAGPPRVVPHGRLIAGMTGDVERLRAAQHDVAHRFAARL